MRALNVGHLILTLIIINIVNIINIIIVCVVLVDWIILKKY